ncbi:MAG: DDE-type integrase/transposase/recombinase [Mycobacterium sp.]|uniref:DDE-type integrase/transposase/recombinase n=1 Tax=Mycobacterium sp. TaxID=1785 RepID=UPI003C769DE5
MASTIRRILHHHALITPQPRKRPKSSYIRFQAEQPNECWQSDFTHWTLSDGSDVEILHWLDDHSRYLLSCTAYRRVAGPDVVASFTATAATSGLPASTLTDNGSVYQAPHQRRPTRAGPKPAHPTPPPNTSASATMSSTNSANSPSATAAACTTSASAAPTHTPPY